MSSARRRIGDPYSCGREAGGADEHVPSEVVLFPATKLTPHFDLREEKTQVAAGGRALPWSAARLGP